MIESEYLITYTPKHSHSLFSAKVMSIKTTLILCDYSHNTYNPDPKIEHVNIGPIEHKKEKHWHCGIDSDN